MSRQRGGAAIAVEQAGWLLAAAIACAGVAWAARTPRLPLRADPAIYAIDLQFPVLPPERALALYQANGALFVDARPADRPAGGALAAQHVPGALTIRAATFDDDLLAVHDFIAPSDALVLYGDGNLLELSAIASRLKARGFEDVRLMAGDLAAWKRAGGPVSGGDDG
jgi:3-mercaptopyruvate sulfurtransferase SseA